MYSNERGVNNSYINQCNKGYNQIAQAPQTI